MPRAQSGTSLPERMTTEIVAYPGPISVVSVPSHAVRQILSTTATFMAGVRRQASSQLRSPPFFVGIFSRTQ